MMGVHGMSAPTHLVPKGAGDGRTLCGLKDAYPRVLADSDTIEAHIRGWGMAVCPECAARRDAAWLATEDGSQGNGTGRHIAYFILASIDVHTETQTT